MTETSDHLKTYAENRDETSFRALVDQHLGMVFGTAVRRTGDRSLSEEIAQNVFTALAKKAGEIRAAAALPAWLHRATILECSKAIRGESRRKKRMEKLIEINALEGDGLAVWKHAASDLDEAVDELPAADREILFQRFYEDKSFREIAKSSGKSEAASQKQASRALQKLAELMRGRGFAVPSVVLAAGFAQEISQAAPANLAASISTSALATAGTSVAVATATKSGILAAMSFSKSTAVGISVALLFVATFSGAGYLSGRASAKAEKLANAKAPEKSTSLPSPTRTAGKPVSKTPPVSKRSERDSVQEIVEMTAVYYIASLDVFGGATEEDGKKAKREIAKLKPGEFEAAIAAAAALDCDNAIRTWIRTDIVGLWARSDGKAAAELVKGEEYSANLRVALIGWCEYAPADAYAWYRESVANGMLEFKFGHNIRSGLLMSLVRAWAETDPKGAFNELANMDYDEQRQLSRAFDQLVLDEQNREQFLTAVKNFPDQRLRSELIDDAIDDWSKIDPVSAAAWFDTVEFESLEVGFKPATELVENWFQRDATAAVNWLWPKTPEHMKDKFVNEFVREEWADRDPESAATWLEQNGFESEE